MSNVTLLQVQGHRLLMPRLDHRFDATDHHVWAALHAATATAMHPPPPAAVLAAPSYARLARMQMPGRAASLFKRHHGISRASLERLFPAWEVPLPP